MDAYPTYPGNTPHSDSVAWGIHVSDLRGPNGELYIAAVDSSGRVRVEVHVHDPNDEEFVVDLLRLYLTVAEKRAVTRHLRLI